MECRPVTGRTHQIRVHLFEKGSPIIGDIHYAKTYPFLTKAPRVMLHARAVAFNDPFSGQTMTFEAPYPEDFKHLLEKLFS